MSETPRLTVLVVDDEALLRWSIAYVLRQVGHDVVEAASATDARGILTRAPAPFDVVLLDSYLPDSNDLSLLEELRWRLPRCAIVLMTVYSTPESLRHALDRGACGVLVKPFDMEQLDALVAQAYQSSRCH